MDHPRPRILIGDDQTSIRRTMTGIIEDLGCQVVGVEDGYRAIESVKNTIFDLVFLDIKMPGINGIQTFREIKKLRPNSLVVMMTGWEVQEVVDTAVDEGAMFVVFKPIEPEQVIHLIRSVYKPCPARLPTDICALVGEIQHRIDSTVKESPIARVTVRIPDGELKALRLLAVSGPASGYTKTLGSFASLGGIAFYNNEVQVINDYQSHPLIGESDISLRVKSALAVPIRSGSDRVLGSVAVSCYEADYFDTEVVERFRGLARGVGDLMETTSPEEAEFLHGLKRVGFPVFESLIEVDR